MTSEPEVERTLGAIFRIETPRLVAGLTRVVRDLTIAEELAQEAFARAVEAWPKEGVPEKPGAWLMAVAKNRAIDHKRRVRRWQRKYEQLTQEFETVHEDTPSDTEFGDDLLRLMFMCCHPVLASEARAALTLRLLGGLTTHEIARAFLVPEPTVAQRIVRAKKTLNANRVSFDVQPEDKDERLASVLEVLYLIYNEGYSATAGSDWMRPELCQDALRLGRVLAQLTPDEPEVHGLVALMEIQSSRVRARTGPDGEPVLLLDQNRALWDALLIHRGLAALERVEALTTTPGPYALQAAIAGCHARAGTAAETDWIRIAALYAALAVQTPSPVVELNRAVAVGMAFGAAAALPLVDALASEPALGSYHLLPAVRGDLLVKLGRTEEARQEFHRAATLAQNERERALLLERARLGS